MCGENLSSFRIATLGGGSPPRVRRKHIQHTVLGDNLGITPACAGKTSFRGVRHRLFCVVEDHPRVCGENSRTRRSCNHRPGSPPRVRGKLFVLPLAVLKLRITPAHAGKTSCFFVNLFLPRDHPRACGENKGQSFWRVWGRGSPPRMRGKPMTWNRSK